jgi:hypothetical protein
MTEKCVTVKDEYYEKESSTILVCIVACLLKARIEKAGETAVVRERP